MTYSARVTFASVVSAGLLLCLLSAIGASAQQGEGDCPMVLGIQAPRLLRKATCGGDPQSWVVFQSFEPIDMGRVFLGIYDSRMSTNNPGESIATCAQILGVDIVRAGDNSTSQSGSSGSSSAASVSSSSSSSSGSSSTSSSAATGGEELVAHVHAKRCEDEMGGAHWMLDTRLPPNQESNEVWFTDFTPTTSPAGSTFSSTPTTRQFAVDSENALSVVIHDLSIEAGNKAACCNLVWENVELAEDSSSSVVEEESSSSSDNKPNDVSSASTLLSAQFSFLQWL